MPVNEQDEGPLQPEQYIIREGSDLEAFILEQPWINHSLDQKRRWIAFAFEGDIRDRRLIFNFRGDRATFSVTKRFPDQLGLEVCVHTDIEIEGLHLQVMEIMED